MAGNRSLFEQAETLKEIPDNGKTIPYTADSESHATGLAIAKHKIQQCNRLDEIIREKLKAAVESGVDVRGAAKTRTRTYVPKFDKKNFEESHPDLYQDFLIESFNWYQRFLPDNKFKKSISINKINFRII